jgi:ATP-dependent RNA helicase SUPV3L1/SUV3
MVHTTINQKAVIAAETAVEATATAAAVAEVHTTINQKAAAIAAETAVKAATTAAAVAEAKTVAEGVAATLRQQLWQRRGQATAGADNNQPKHGRNGSQGGGNKGSRGRGEDSKRGGGKDVGADSFSNDGGKQLGGANSN